MSDWSRPLRVVQFLLRDADALATEPRALVAAAVDWGANALLVNAAGFSAWYPTRLAYQRTNASLGGDFLGQVLALAHGRGLRFIARVDVSKLVPSVAAEHPDWVRRDAADRIVTEWEMPETCFTGPHWQRHAFEIVDELLGAYPVDAVFFNMYRVAHCHCARCAAALRALGVPRIPARADAADPAWRAYECWRRAALLAYTVRLRAAVRARRDAALLVYHHQKEGWDVPGIARASDLVAVTASLPQVANPLSPQPAWPGWPGAEAALARGLRPDRPGAVVTTTSGLFASRRAAQPPARVRAALLQVAFQRGAPAAALPGAVEQEDARAIPAVASAFRWLARHEAIFARLTSDARIALLSSCGVQELCPVPGEPRAARDEERGLYLALTHAGQPFDVVPLDGRGPELSRYRAAFLPAAACLSDRDAVAIDAFVQAGGTLVASALAGTHDEGGEARDRSPLRSLGRPRLAATLSAAGGYLRVRDAALRDALGGPRVIGAHDDVFVFERERGVAADDLHLLGPSGNNTPEYALVPDEPGTPGLVGLALGAGFAWHLAWRPGALTSRHGLRDPALVLGWLASRAAGLAPFALDRPDGVEARYWRAGDRERVLLLLDVRPLGSGLATDSAIGPLEVTLRTRVRRVYSLASGVDLEPRARPDGSVVALEGRGSFEALHITVMEDRE